MFGKYQNKLKLKGQAAKRLVSAVVVLAVATIGTFVLLFSHASPAYVTSWVGNTYGVADTAVQEGTGGMTVASDGTVYNELSWNEAPREIMGYRPGTGQTFGPYTDLHEDIPNGGNGMGVDTNYVYAIARYGNQAGVQRYDRNLNIAPFSGGGGTHGAMIVVNNLYEGLSALTVSHGQIYVADPQHSYNVTSAAPEENTLIKIYSTATMSSTPAHSFAAPRARGIAVDGNGYIWVLQQSDSSNAPDIRRYAPDGTPTSQVITGIADPRGIAIDTSAGGVGRLLVTDNGPDQNVKIFTNIDTTPTLSSTLGVKGGINAGPVRGQVGPLRFNGPNTIGVDSSGNIYVASNGMPTFATDPDRGLGMSLEAYKPNGTQIYNVYGQDYSQMGALDPSTNTDVYTDFDHYKVDLSKPVGQQWSRVGWTQDKFRYPHDPRISDSGNGLPDGPTNVRVLDGHKFLFMSNGLAGPINIFRFNGTDETAIPSASIEMTKAKASPSAGEFIWRDGNGDGDPYTGSGEYSVVANNQNGPEVEGWWTDTSGNIWAATKNSIIRFRFQGLDSVGNPIYSFSAMDTYPMPAPFSEMRRLSYDAATDTIYLIGYTSANPVPFASQDNDDYKFAGTTLVRINNWSTGNRTPAWTKVVPYDLTDTDHDHKTMDMEQAGNYVFVGYFAHTGAWPGADVYAFDASTGAQAQVFEPGPEVGGDNGAMDMMNGMNANVLPNGEYVIMVEDDRYDKTLMFEWCPSGNCPNTVSPTPAPAPDTQAPSVPAALTSTAQTNSSISLTWNASTDNTGVTGYHVYRNGTLVGSPSGTSYTDSGLSVNTAYSYTVSAYDAAGNTSSQSTALSVSTKTQPPPISSLPSPWQEINIGSQGQAGSVSASNGTFSLTGGGYDIWDTSDNFSYVYQTASGDTDLVTRVKSMQDTNGWAKAGIMFRSALTGTSPHVSLFLTPENGVAFHYRTTDGSTSGYVDGGSATAPVWLKLSRRGNVFTAYRSADGTNWTNLGNITVTMPTQVYAGLAVASANLTSTNTATFDNVSIVTPSQTSTPPSAPTPKPGDVNGDGVVNIIDLAILSKYWGQNNVTRSQGDLNGDGVVNVFDLAILSKYWET